MSLRVRLALWYALALAAVMVLYGAFVYLTVERWLWERLDAEIHDDYERAETMLVNVAEYGGVISLADDAAHPAEPPPVVHVLGADGRTIRRSPGFVEDGTLRIREWPHEVKASSPGTRAETVTIRVGRPVEEVRRQLRLLLGVLAVGLPIGVGAAALGGYLLARRALAPIAEMADRARTITAERLSERLPVENPGDEVGRLAVVFNETLARLEQSFDRLRRFTADASHELRTPLTALRTVGEVGLREPRDPAAYREVIGSMLEEVDRVTRLVESLLLLSRADAGQVPLRREPLEVSALVREVAERLGVLAEEKRVRVSVEAPPSPGVQGDPTLLRQALENLLDNAIRLSPEGGTVRIAVRDAGGALAIEVGDEGPGIAPEHRARVFDRFYRVDEARSRDRGGAGLGLAIAWWAVEAHGGRIELESEVGKGSTFRIVLPREGGTGGGAS